MPQLSGKFFSAEKTGFLTVSDLFLSVYADMTANGFDVINLSNPSPSNPASTIGYNLITERYTADGNPDPTPPVPWAWKANVRIATATTHFPGEKLFINPADAPPVLINGIPQAESYVIVTKTKDPVTGITYSSKYNASGTIVPTGLVVEVSDVVNGNIGFTGTDYPTFEGNLNITASPFPLTQDPLDPTISNYLGLLKESVTTPGTAGTTVSDVGVCFRIGTPDYFSFTLECGPDIDPNNKFGSGNSANQPWRVQFVVSGPQQALGSVAAPLQMAFDPSLGRVSIAKVTDSSGAVVDNVGSLGAWEPGGIFTQSDFRQGFVNRTQRVADQDRTYPLSYILTIAERGFFLGIWEGNWSTQLANAGYPNDYASNFFNWVVVQRPVDRNTGRILISGKAPVFALNGVGYYYYKAIVREADVLHPSGGPSLQLGTGKLIIQTKPPYQIFGGVDTNTNLTSNFLLEFEIGTSIWDRATNQLVGVVGSIFNETTAYLDGKPPQSAINQLDLANSSLNLTSSILTSDTSLASISSGTALVTFNYIGPNQTPYRIYADRHSDGSHMLFNSQNQVSLTEDKTYLLTFPHNLTTPRFRYTEELDLMGTTSSDVVRTGQDVQFVTYGEWGPRTYRALPGSNVNNTGLRVAALFKPQGPKFKGVQTGTALGLPTGTYDPITKNWGNPDPGTGIVLVTTQEIGSLNGNLSAVSADTLTPGAVVGPLIANQPWTPTGIQFVGSAIPQFATVDPVHGNNLRYSITRNLSQVQGVGIGIDPVTGILALDPTLATGVAGTVNSVGYLADTIVPFTVTIQNDLTDNENSGASSGQNSIDVYLLYKPM